MNFKLDDIVPRATSFIIQRMGGGKKSMKLHLRPFTLRDQDWVQQRWSDEELAVICGKPDCKEFTELVFHQLEGESKREVLAVKVVESDDKGEEVELDLPGAEKLRYLLSDVKSIQAMFEALMQCRGLSMPQLRKLAALADKDKKKLKANL